jgi:ribonuclease HI
VNSLRTTWLCRIGHLEQDVSRQLYDIARTLDSKIALAFVFSHVGGVVGNDRADELAVEACKHRGGQWRAQLWHIDTTRRILNIHHAAADAIAARDKAFRFRSMPEELLWRPSPPLPRELTRAEETLLYRARLGLVVEAGGSVHGHSESCILCGEEDAMRRDGAALTHLLECVRYTISPPLHIELEDLWRDPLTAAKQLGVLQRSLLRTHGGAQRALDRADIAVATAARRRRAAAALRRAPLAQAP